MSHKTETDTVPSGAKNVIRNGEESCKSIKEVQVDKSYHKVRDSLFSSSSLSSVNNSGVFNLFFTILVLSNACVALENIQKYGILINPVLWLKIYFLKLTEVPSVLILSGFNISLLSSLGLEILMSKGILNNKVGLILAALLLTLEVFFPLLVICFIDSFAIAFTIVVSYITVFLKLVSYHMVNYWCRKNIASDSKSVQPSILTDQNRLKDFKSGDKDKNMMQYPDNLNIKDIYYFLFAPTLCYELNFPLLSHIRKKFLFKRVLEMLFLLLLIISVMQQLIIPIVIDYQDTFQDLNYVKIFEVYFKLAIPFFTVWMLCFYFVFHTWLNVIGEIWRFGDRLFYDDWWNAESMAHWWRKWNIPVHKWCLRHIYKPLLQSGCTKLQAISVVFFVSGVFHEYLFSIPLKIFKIFMFVGIFFGQQIYFAFANDQPQENGNISLWINFVFFQPFILLYYYYGFYVEHFQNKETKP